MISIVFPVYKVSEYIENCMRSVCAQNNKDFEVILVDDGSPDASIAKAEKILREGNIKFNTIRQENAGVSAARNAGMRQAKGDWVLCVDPDDVLCPDFLSFVEGSEWPVVIKNYKMVKRKTLFKPPKKTFENEIISKSDALKGFLCRKLPIISPAIFLRKDFLLKHALVYDESMRFCEDMLFVWKVLFAAERIAYNKTPVYNYYLHTYSTMTSSGLEKIMTGVSGFSIYCRQLNDLGEYKEITAKIFPRWLLGALRTASKTMTRQDFEILLDSVEYKHYLYELLRFPEIKARILSYLLKLSPDVFYWFCQKF